VNASAELRIDGLHAGYGQLSVLHDISMVISPGELVVVSGPNGAGKTTLLLCLMGMIAPTSGQIRLGERDLIRLPVRDRLRSGIALVPEGRGLFPGLSVWENLQVACKALGLDEAEQGVALTRAISTFPIIGERPDQSVRSLSGGEQQMLAIARALLGDPSVLLLDEPSMGLAPIIWTDVLQRCRRLADDGRVVLLVEQRVLEAVGPADRCVILQQGRVVDERAGGPEAAADPGLLREYFALEDSG
jgi:branched-chain amino acid transport system ATP-binding protein